MVRRRRLRWPARRLYFSEIACGPFRYPFVKSIRLTHLARQNGAQLADDALGGEDHDEDEGDAEHHLPALGIGADHVLQRDNRGGADESAEQRADATGDHHQYTLDRLR